MDIHVAIFLLVFLFISSLATIGICCVEIRSCWLNYRMQMQKDELSRLECCNNGSSDGMEPHLDQWQMHQLLLDEEAEAMGFPPMHNIYEEDKPIHDSQVILTSALDEAPAHV